MGIKSYVKNLIEEFPDIASKKKPYNIEILCIDLNELLHKSCYISSNNEEFKNNLISKINKLVNRIKPKELSIFTDGQAILAKARTQIVRRNKYLYSTPENISPLNLTPGTPFMDFVDSLVEEYLSGLKIKTYYSSSRENNEGELKLFNWLLVNGLKNRVCIFGSDADLIVLALASRPLLDLYVYNKDVYISLFKLVDNISNIASLKKFSYQTNPVRLDFVLLSMFMGNDYNNKISKFEYIIKAYRMIQKENKSFLVKKDGSINLILLKKLFVKLEKPSLIVNDKVNSYNYINALQWNLNLYQGIINNRYIPKYGIVNVSTLIKYFPSKIVIPENKVDWLKPEVYTLLLMPVTGKELLPDKLKILIDTDSPVKDLFPEPCLECINYKKELKIKPPNDDENSQVYKEFKEFVRKMNEEYSNHLDKNHSFNDLPIKRLEDAVESLK